MAPGSSNVVARRVIDEIFECYGETGTPKYMKLFRRLIRVLRDEVDIAKSALCQVKERSRKEQNQNKTGQKREAWLRKDQEKDKIGSKRDKNGKRGE
nr:hypothetical protein [Tanacetum cinerariifolium]